MKKILCAFTAAAIAVTAFSGCGGEPEFSSDGRTYLSMNTVAELVISDKFTAEKQEKFNEMCDKVNDELERLELSLSLNKENSPVSRFNAAAAGETVEVDFDAYTVFTLAKQVYELTDGYYNPAVYYSVQAYGFNGSADTDIPNDERIPVEEDIENYKNIASHFGEVDVYGQDGKYYVKKPSASFTENGTEYTMKVDLGGIGKGYATDKINAIIDSYGFEYGYFSFGTSSMHCKKHYKNSSYTLGLLNPRGAGNYAGIAVRDVSLSTSGDYQQYFILDGVRYCHVFNPKTGKPVQTGIMTATVIGGSAAQGDAITTALMAMGKDGAVQFINDNLSNLKVILSFEEEECYSVITNVPSELKITSSDYKIINTVTDGKIVIGD